MLSEAPFREVGKMRRPAQAVIVHGVAGGLLAGMLLNQEFAQVTPRLIAAYTVLHFGVFAILGVGMAWLSAALPAPSRLLLGLLFGLLLQEVVFYVGLLLLHAPHLGVLPWPHVVGANIAAGLVLMTYLHYAEHDPRPLGLPALDVHPTVARGIVTGLGGAAVVAVWFFSWTSR